LFATIIELDRLEFSKVKYYSVLIEGRTYSEFLDFQHRMRAGHPTQLGELNMLIKQIGNEYGAEKHFFRDERQAEALPPEFFDYNGEDDEDPTNQFGLRLYCLRGNESVVILFNGDLKTSQKAGDCSKCKKHFDLANKITAAIDKGIVSKAIKFESKKILGIEDFEFEI
jgi:hypothetical protein